MPAHEDTTRGEWPTMQRFYSKNSVHTTPVKSEKKKKITRLEKIGVIEKINEPTDWCVPMVLVWKKSRGARICTDFKRLSAAVKREHYILPSVKDIMHYLKEATIFSKLDATSEFFQIPLDVDAAELTTFITPCWR